MSGCSKRNLDCRKKMILAMEFICRQINDEEILESWLRCGVPDGSIKYGEFDPQVISSEDSMVADNESFKDLMIWFLRCMSAAEREGGLYCDGIKTGDKLL